MFLDAVHFKMKQGRGECEQRVKTKYRVISKNQECVLVVRDRQRTTYSGVLVRGYMKMDEKRLAVIYRTPTCFVRMPVGHLVSMPMRKA
jgi:hypothetical protein